MYFRIKIGDVAGKPEMEVVFVTFRIANIYVNARNIRIKLYEGGFDLVESNGGGTDENVIRKRPYPYKIFEDRDSELDLPKISDWIDEDCETKVVFCNEVRVCQNCHSAGVTELTTEPPNAWDFEEGLSTDAARLKLLQFIPSDFGEPFRWDLCRDCSKSFQARDYGELLRYRKLVYHKQTEREKIFNRISRRAAIAESNRRKSKLKLSPFFGEIHAINKIK